MRLANLDLLLWQWHDADVHELKTSWSDDGELTVSLRCEINPEEDRSHLVELGVQSALVELHFMGVSRLQTNLIGTCANREVLLDWDTLATAPFHHRIRFSCGSQIDIVFQEVWLDETK